MKSVLLDTNLLLLYLVGRLDPSRIGRKRLSQFDSDDFVRLEREVDKFPKHISVPNVLTEVSNLVGDAKQETVPNGRKILAWYCHEVVDEIYYPSRDVVQTPAYMKFGLADAAIVEVAVKRGVTVLTGDHSLYGFLGSNGLAAWNIFHDKTPGWVK